MHFCSLHLCSHLCQSMLASLFVCIEVVHCNASKRKSGDIMKLNGLPLCLQARVHACFGRMYACMCLSLHRSLYLFM